MRGRAHVEECLERAELFLPADDRRCHCCLLSNRDTARAESQLAGCSAYSTSAHSAFASRICSTVRPRMSSSFGLTTRIARHFARETATFSRLRENRTSIIAGDVLPLD